MPDRDSNAVPPECPDKRPSSGTLGHDKSMVVNGANDVNVVNNVNSVAAPSRSNDEASSPATSVPGSSHQQPGILEG